jgi:HK97 family phage major capsid protein
MPAQSQQDLITRRDDARATIAHILRVTREREATREEMAVADAADMEVRRLDKQLATAQDNAVFRSIANGGSLLPRGAGHSLGQQFLESETYQWLQATKASRPEQWHSPSSELTPPSLMAATTITGDPASGGALVIPQYIPGIVPVPTPPIVVADLFAQGLATSGVIVWMKETQFDNQAAVVAEGTLKPQSGLTFASVTDPLQNIAHWFAVTEQQIADVAQMASVIDQKLMLGVRIVLDYQLLNGTGAAGTPPEIEGILPRPDLAPAVAVGTTKPLTAIAKQISAIENAQQLPVDGIVLNPADWIVLQTTESTVGEYLSGSPFDSKGPNTLWGRPVALTPQIAEGTALVGCFRTAAMLFRNGPIRVAASNSHQDFFTKNLIAIRGEQRAQLALYRPGAFGLVTGLTAVLP